MLVFVHINKTAGSTVRYILRSSYGTRHCDVEPWPDGQGARPFSTEDLRRLRRIYPRLASIAGHRVTGYADLRENGTEFAYFTFLRDPLKLCASRFQYHVDHRKKTHLVFEEWIRQDWLRNAQTQRIAGTQNVDDAIRIIEKRQMFVGLTERFDESLVLLKALRAADLDLGYAPVNVAKKSSIASALLDDETSRAALAEANDADLALYEYVNRELYPAFEREFGDGLADAVAEYRSHRRPSFNRRKLTASRAKRHGLYRPLLRLYGSRGTGRLLERLLDRPRPTDNPI